MKTKVLDGGRFWIYKKEKRGMWNMLDLDQSAELSPKLAQYD